MQKLFSKGKAISLILVFVLILSMLPAMAMPALAAESATLAILSTTDMHGRIYSSDPASGSTVHNTYLKASTVINGAREEYDAAIAIDNGDSIQGTVMTSYNVNVKNGVENPVGIAIRHIGYDVFVPGNHEFNYVQDIQKKFYDILLDGTDKYANDPVSVLAANILDAATEEVADPFAPYVVHTVKVGEKTFKVGVLGFENVNVPNWDPEAHYQGMIFSHKANEEQSFAYEWDTYWKEKLIEDEGCDIIVLSIHSGNGPAPDAAFNKENQIQHFISATEGVDLVIGGHDHTARNTVYKNKNGDDVQMVNGGGGNVTKTVFKLNDDGTFALDSSELVALNNSVENDAELQELMKPYYDAAAEFVTEPIGTLSGEWDDVGNYFLKQGDGIDLVHKAQIWATGADVSISGPVNRNDFYPGSLFEEGAETANISLKDIYNLYRYDNNLLYMIEMTGAQLKSWVSKTAEYYTIKDGAIDAGGFGLDTFYGIDYKVFVGEDGKNTTEVLYKGKPLSDTEVLKVALCSYRLSAGADNDAFGWYEATGLSTEGSHVKFVAAETEQFGAVGGSVTLIIGEYIKEMCKGDKTITPGRSTTYEILLAEKGNDEWENPFTDVKADDWFYGDVEYVATKGLYKGTTTTTFSPNAQMTRAMVVTVLWRLSDQPEVEGVYGNFADVEQGSYYEKAVAWASKNELVKGYGGGFFGPHDPITREQLAVILYRFAESPEFTAAELEFVDAGDVSEWAVDALVWACAEKLIKGKDGNIFDPLGTATRAEVAALLHRYANK